MTFCELKGKDVININDGKRLGKPVDIVFAEAGGRAWAEALVVPGQGGAARFLRPSREGCAIPWERIRRIGEDVILVDAESSSFS